MSHRAYIHGVRNRTLILSFILASAGLLRAQEPFRSGVDLVQINVVVLDRQRQPVRGLSAADFTVLDEGEVRRVVAFDEVVLPDPPSPATATWLVEEPADVTNNTLAPNGRLVVIMFDRSIRAGADVVTARKIAREAVDGLRAGDLAAIVRTSGIAGEGASQNFTADRARLRAAIDSPFIGLVAPPNMTPDGLQASSPELRLTGDCMCGVCVLESIARAAEAMETITQRQKSLLFIGTDIVMTARGQCDAEVRRAREKAMRALDRANVTVHAVETSGLVTLAKTADAFPKDPRPSAAAHLERQGNLGVLPAYTGGRTVLNTNGIAQPVQQIFEETRSYYLLAIERSPSTRRDQRRALRVRVNRKDVIVRTRNAYFGPTPVAPGATNTDRSAAAIGDLLPKSDIPMELALVPTFSADKAVTVRALLRMQGASGSFDVTLGVFDERARPVMARRHVIGPSAGATSTCDPVCELAPVLSLKPGSYEVRAGIASHEGARTASVYAYVDVPELRDAELSLSGVIIETARSNVTLRRTFTAADAISASLQVRRAGATAGAVAMKTRVTDRHDRTVAEVLDELDASRFNAAGVADYRFIPPLTALAPGPYLLTIDASAGRYNSTRKLRFDVR
jgi:VWFA-related protein